MPEHKQFNDLFQKLEQLNRLEEEQELARRSGHSALDTEARMESLRSNIPLNVLMQHDRLRARGRYSVAQVKNGVCSGCHMSLPVGTFSEVKRQVHPVKCDYCGRFIFQAQDTNAPSPIGATKAKHSSRQQDK